MFLNIKYLGLVILLISLSTISYAQQGMGVGNNNPEEMLDVSGAIKLGTTTSTNAGTIRWTGTDFQGWDGTQWITFGGGASTQLTEAEVDAFVANNGYLTAEVDGSITNEIQDLNLTGNILTITNNGSATSIDLSPYVNSLIGLDGAYDQGGAGAGREIDAVDGTVAITGEDGIMVSGTYGSGLAVGATGGIADGAGTRMFFNPNKAAFRAGTVNGTQWDDANIGVSSTAMGEGTTASGDASTAMGANTNATGDVSTAMGLDTEASGFASTAMGLNTEASGPISTAMGGNTNASGNFSTAMGSSTTASGDYSIAMGEFATAPSYAETAIGRYNTTYTPASATAWNTADRLFVVGNGTGTGANSSNALTITKDGTMKINDAYDMPTADGAANFVMSTDGAGVVSFVDPNTLVTPTTTIFANTSGVTSNENGTYATDDFVFGSPQLADNGNTANDKRLFFDKSKGAFRAGRVTGTQWDAANIGNHSTAMGYNASASGNTSTAMGSYTTASGDVSTAMGEFTSASGFASTAMGVGTTASGNFSTAMGRSTTAPSYAETSVGRYNTTYTPASTAWNTADRLFVVGNGTGAGVNSSNALTIYKDGKMNINDAYDMPTADGAANFVMSTDGAGVVSFVDPNTLVTPTTTIFANTSGVTSNENGTYATDDFVFGAAQLDNIAGTDDDKRLFFDKSKGAFRAGSVDGTQWDDANIGYRSTAMGYNASASGGVSTAMGYNTTAPGPYSTAMGKGTDASGSNSTAMGQSTTASGTLSTAMGELTSASGFASTAMGVGTTASGAYSTAMGGNTYAPGDYSTAMGANTNATGNTSTAMGSNTTASGNTSTAMGSNTTASGDVSTAMGFGTNASGDYSTAIGNGTTALGDYSTAMGVGTNASGSASTAMGRSTTAPSYAETSVGRYNTTYTPASTTAWNTADRLFVVGNGTYTGLNSSNALTIYKDGKMNINDAYDMPTADGTANFVMSTDGNGVVSFVNPNTLVTPTTTNTLDGAYDQGGAGAGRVIDAVDGTVAITGEDGIMVSGTFGSGLAVGATGGIADGAGTRMFFNPNRAAFRAGYVNGTQWDDANIGEYSTAMGFSTTASGDYSTAMGRSTSASGSRSTAMGASTTASGNYSTAMGQATIASGTLSTAMGSSTTASGNYSTAMGRSTTAPSYAETAVGHYNTTYTPASTTAWNTADRLFVVGNGTGTGVNSSNALTITKDGTMNINDAYDMPTIGGTSGQVLTTNGTVATWTDPADDGDWTVSGNDQYSAVSGNVGIGTTTPDYSLDVNGNIGVGNGSNGYIYNNGDANTYIKYTNDRIQFMAGSGSSSWIDMQQSVTEMAINENGVNRDLRVEGGNDANLLFVDGSADKIGIGTNAPTEILDVDGQIRMRTGATSGFVPASNANGVMTWTDPNTLVTPTTTNTLDGAYDQGGAGTGRVIDAVDGTVAITGEDGIVVSGTYGSGLAVGATGGIAQGAGTRMFFNPKKAAFRAGYVNGTKWDAANIGDYSTAMGYDTKASGLASTAMGGFTTASGVFSTAMGQNTEATGDYSTAMGQNTEASGERSIAMGDGTTASGNISTAMGGSATASGYVSTAMGASTTAAGAYSTAMGAGYRSISTCFHRNGLGYRSNRRLFHRNGSEYRSIRTGFHRNGSEYRSNRRFFHRNGCEYNRIRILFHRNGFRYNRIRRFFHRNGCEYNRIRRLFHRNGL